jgi:hypothetical protein
MRVFGVIFGVFPNLFDIFSFVKLIVGEKAMVVTVENRAGYFP